MNLLDVILPPEEDIISAVSLPMNTLVFIVLAVLALIIVGLSVFLIIWALKKK